MSHDEQTFIKHSEIYDAAEEAFPQQINPTSIEGGDIDDVAGGVYFDKEFYLPLGKFLGQVVGFSGWIRYKSKLEKIPLDKYGDMEIEDEDIKITCSFRPAINFNVVGAFNNPIQGTYDVRQEIWTFESWGN